jgi:GNAT superfamily N-acetyltransferase
MLRLTDKVDLDVYYEIDAVRFDDAVRRVVTRDAFKAVYANCPSVGFESNGRAIGGVIYDGKSAHIAVLPSYHGRWAFLLNAMLAWLFSLSDEIFVRIETGNRKGLAFVERCGWQRIGIDGDDVVYRMTPDNGSRVACVSVAARSSA